MNKVSGKKSDFSLLREDKSRIIIGYDLKKVTGKNMYEWYEVYINKKEKSFISYQDVEDAIIDDINAQVDEKILTGYTWTLLHGWKTVDGETVDLTGQTTNVWLSNENQNNYSEAHLVAQNPPQGFLPITFKVWEDEEKRAVYEKFYTYEELDAFYLGGAAFKNAVLNEGWVRKDSIDWTPYEALFPTPEPPQEQDAE